MGCDEFNIGVVAGVKESAVKVGQGVASLGVVSLVAALDLVRLRDPAGEAM